MILEYHSIKLSVYLIYLYTKSLYFYGSYGICKKALKLIIIIMLLICSSNGKLNLISVTGLGSLVGSVVRLQLINMCFMTFLHLAGNQEFRGGGDLRERLDRIRSPLRNSPDRRDARARHTSHGKRHLSILDPVLPCP